MLERLFLFSRFKTTLAKLPCSFALMSVSIELTMLFFNFEIVAELKRVPVEMTLSLKAKIIFSCLLLLA